MMNLVQIESHCDVDQKMPAVLHPASVPIQVLFLAYF